MSATRRQAVALLAALVANLTTRAANAESRRAITFILVNDIYLMADEPGPDGQRRGGFPRLAAVVKAERAKGGHVLFAHGGDTLSPSVMSGIDRGAHIVALTNMVRPDIFVPGNHEFDFGKATFLRTHGRSQFPALCRQPPGTGRPAAAEVQGSRDHYARWRADRPDRRRLRPVGLGFDAWRPPVRADARDHEGAGRRTAPRGCRLRRGSRARHPQGRLRGPRHRTVRPGADRTYPRPVHQLQRPARHGGVRVTTPTMSPSSTSGST